MARAIPKTVSTHYQKAPQPHRTIMIEMRKRILKVVPGAEEVISYGMPAFKVNGSVVAGLLANKSHVGYYPFSGSVLANFSADLHKYSHTKSALHIPLNKPLPQTLIAKLIKARISQCPVKQGKVDLDAYSSKDGVWRGLGVAAPARRALVDAKLLKLRDLKNITRADFMKLHGMGPSASAIIVKAMKTQSRY